MFLLLFLDCRSANNLAYIRCLSVMRQTSTVTTYYWILPMFFKLMLLILLRDSSPRRSIIRTANERTKDSEKNQHHGHVVSFLRKFSFFFLFSLRKYHRTTVKHKTQIRLPSRCGFSPQAYRVKLDYVSPPLLSVDTNCCVGIPVRQLVWNNHCIIRLTNKSD